MQQSAHQARILEVMLDSLLNFDCGALIQQLVWQFYTIEAVRVLLLKRCQFEDGDGKKERICILPSECDIRKAYRPRIRQR